MQANSSPATTSLDLRDFTLPLLPPLNSIALVVGLVGPTPRIAYLSLIDADDVRIGQGDTVARDSRGEEGYECQAVIDLLLMSGVRDVTCTYIYAICISCRGRYVSIVL